MLRRLLFFVLLLLLAGWVATLLSGVAGEAVIRWEDFTIAIHSGLLAAIIIAIVVAVILLDRLMGAILGLPGRLAGNIRRRRKEQSHEAVALGLITVALGDEAGAAKHARRARRLGGDDRLTGLLDAQLATLKGDTSAAGKFFRRLAGDRATAWLGHAATMRLARDAGDSDAALAAGRAAMAARGRNAEPGVARAVFALEAAAGNWQRAIDALHIARRMEKGRGKNTGKNRGDNTARALAVLYYELAMEYRQEGEENADAALKSLTEAARHDPGLIPAVVDAATTLRERGKARQATALLEKSFLQSPHPDIAALLSEKGSGGNTKSLSRLMHLAERGGNSIEAISACALRALDHGLWGEARRLAERVPADERDTTLWTVLAEVGRHAPQKTGKAAKDDWPDPEDCLIQAAKAPRAAAWTCNDCGALAQKWQSRCPACDAFATLEWRMSRMR